MGGVADIGRSLAEITGERQPSAYPAHIGRARKAQPGLQVRLKSPTDRW
jgi:hypothetical protein